MMASLYQSASLSIIVRDSGAEGLVATNIPSGGGWAVGGGGLETRD